MNKKRVGLAAASALVLGITITACANQTVRDLENVPVKDPQKLELYVNVDKYANVVRLCIDGVAFAATTREYQPLLRVPEWDKSWCGASPS